MTRYPLAVQHADAFPDLPFDERDAEELLAAYPGQ